MKSSLYRFFSTSFTRHSTAEHNSQSTKRVSGEEFTILFEHFHAIAPNAEPKHTNIAEFVLLEKSEFLKNVLKFWKFSFIKSFFAASATELFNSLINIIESWMRLVSLSSFGSLYQQSHSAAAVVVWCTYRKTEKNTTLFGAESKWWAFMARLMFKQ